MCCQRTAGRHPGITWEACDRTGLNHTLSRRKVTRIALVKVRQVEVAGVVLT
jgi:hypothetical protein